MTRIVLAAALTLLAAPAFASDETDIVAAINAMNDAMTKNDVKTAAAAYTANGAIIDEFAPHIWSGADAFGSWSKDFAAYSSKQGDSDPKVVTQRPLRVFVEGDRGYAVLPAIYTFKEHGKGRTEHALWTFAMQKDGGAWKIAGWSWARR